MHLISYDIKGDRLRTKIAKTLIQYGMYRVQYSVFMGELKERSFTALMKALRKHLQDKTWTQEDTIMILPLHQYSEDHLEFLGKKPTNWLEIQGDLFTLIL